MFVCMYTDDDGIKFFGYGESLEASFENLDQVYLDVDGLAHTGQALLKDGHNDLVNWGPGTDLAPDDNNIEFFEKIAVQYVTRPRFERV